MSVSSDEVVYTSTGYTRLVVSTPLQEIINVINAIEISCHMYFISVQLNFGS